MAAPDECARRGFHSSLFPYSSAQLIFCPHCGNMLTLSEPSLENDKGMQFKCDTCPYHIEVAAEVRAAVPASLLVCGVRCAWPLKDPLAAFGSSPHSPAFRFEKDIRLG